MSNIIQFKPLSPKATPMQRIQSVLELVAQSRRRTEDVFWLKENAEALNVLESSGQDVTSDALSVYDEFYDTIEQKLQFFPQYYRFFLSIALDLESLGFTGGFAGGKAADLTHWCAAQQLVEGELSDLQRAEARRLAQRVDVQLTGLDGLDQRLHHFMNTSATFALPNKKAAYELTHIIFYLSEYGRRDPGVSDQAIKSLHFVGILLMLEQNADLLAEVCIALRFCGATVPADWVAWLEKHLSAAQFGTRSVMADDYHQYLMCDWLAQLHGSPCFEMVVPDQVGSIDMPEYNTAALRHLSHAIMETSGLMAVAGMATQTLSVSLPTDVYDMLEFVADTSEHFDEFFEKFTRQSPILQRDGNRLQAGN